MTMNEAKPLLEITWLQGWCPVQAEGFIYGMPFYFRARHEGWRLEVDGEIIARGKHGGDPHAAGYMPLKKAAELIAFHAIRHAMPEDADYDACNSLQESKDA